MMTDKFAELLEDIKRGGDTLYEAGHLVKPLIDLVLMAENSLKSAKEELWECHSHCDPETSSSGEAMAWRDCRDALAAIEAFRRGGA